MVVFTDAITKIELSLYVITRLALKWYPEEGGAQAALCRGYQRRTTTLVRMVGSSEMVTEETWIFFESRKLREVMMYTIPGSGLNPDLPPHHLPYAERVKQQVF